MDLSTIAHLVRGGLFGLLGLLLGKTVTGFVRIGEARVDDDENNKHIIIIMRKIMRIMMMKNLIEQVNLIFLLFCTDVESTESPMYVLT